MKNEYARNQLCKMLGEVGCVMGLEMSTPCTCGEGPSFGDDVPDDVVSEMWKAINYYTRMTSALRKLKDMPSTDETVLAVPLTETEETDGHEPGEVIAELSCPCCGACLSVEYGDDSGEIVAVGATHDPGMRGG